ncbi:MAG TPA: hypothetical protein VH833_03550 [Gemmatimonadales bacterium]
MPHARGQADRPAFPFDPHPHRLRTLQHVEGIGFGRRAADG